MFLFALLFLAQFEEVVNLRPAVPLPVVICQHPWLATQPDVEEPWSVDLELFDEFCATQKEPKEKLLALAIEKLTQLQASIPFTLPKDLYNVLFISDPLVVKRLYLGETALGMPAFLDVRLYEVDKHEVQSVLDGYFAKIKGEFEKVGEAYIALAERISDSSHGLATERFVYLEPRYHDGCLYVLFADLPLEASALLKRNL